MGCLQALQCYRKNVGDDKRRTKGGGHNRGIAVDLTVIDRTTGTELDMGTGFDNFTDTAHQNFKNLPQAILDNRALLKTVMEKKWFRRAGN